jgi:protein-serine/threonine kinase
VNPSRNPSRAASFSSTWFDKASLKEQQASSQTKVQLPLKQQAQSKLLPPPTAHLRRPNHSEHGGQKFNLKDLLASSPGLVRRASQRSAGSKQSGSERGASSIGETTASLSKKYGVCERIAIGKGATSVVRLVHKWDRTEEKLYAVKVRRINIFSPMHSTEVSAFRNFARDGKQRQRRSMSRN